MKKLFLSVLILLSVISGNAQSLHLTLFAGSSNYQGDMQSKRFTFQQADIAVGVGVLYELTQKLYLRGAVTFAKVKGSDKISGAAPERNLNFISPITDVTLGLEYDLLNSNENSLVPYVFAGITAFHFNPYTFDSSGNKYYLQPLGTEGQGFFMGRKKYSLNAMALPFGGGIKLALSENIKLRFEIGLRATFTDYLDDVSKTYADGTLLLLNNGPKAVELAFRGELESGAPYPEPNSIRGSPKSKDWYYFTGLGISFRLSALSGSGKGKTGCPVNIY